MSEVVSTRLRLDAGSSDVTDEQVLNYLQQGFLVLPRLIGADEIELLERDTIALARGRYPCDALRPLAAGLSEQQVLERLLCIHQPHYMSPVMRRFVAHPKIVTVLGRITAAHLAPGCGTAASSACNRCCS